MVNVEGVRGENVWGMKETAEYVRQNLLPDESNREEIFERLLSRNEFSAEKINGIIDLVIRKVIEDQKLEEIVNQYILQGKDNEFIMTKLLGRSTDVLGVVTVSRLTELIKKLRGNI